MYCVAAGRHSDPGKVEHILKSNIASVRCCCGCGETGDGVPETLPRKDVPGFVTGLRMDGWYGRAPVWLAWRGGGRLDERSRDSTADWVTAWVVRAATCVHTSRWAASCLSLSACSGSSSHRFVPLRFSIEPPKTAIERQH